MKTFYWSLVLMMLLPSMAYTQNTEKENEFSMSMQIRPRAEYRNGAWFPRNEGVKAASSINNRARLSIDYKRSDLEIKMSAQHVGVWGQDPQIDKNGRFVLNEAWAKLDFGHGLFAQLGRQALVYDDERILGGLDWNVAGRYHDALKLGLAVFFCFILGMWVSLERPPMRTMGETRLWYSFFLPLAGLITYIRWKYKWILSFSCVLSLVFICINIFKPEIHNKTLMPALQSPWFAPHVIVYMFAYAMLGAAVVMAIYLLWFKKEEIERKEMDLCDNLTYVGLAFMTLGMLTGAIWAKEAWGHYWAWDPKETWAAATWFSYLTYIHFRLGKPLKVRPALVILLVSFVLLQMCWYGINYLPSAQGVSVHTYNLN